MPKERRDRSVSFDRSRASSPYSCGSSHSRQLLSKNPLENEKNVKDWEDARCPVCMEHPHNAVLLLCTSHEKGCRPFMCDTSYRHSNCFDQFKKSFQEASAASSTQQVEIPASASIMESTSAISQALSELPGERTEGGSISLGALSCENHEIKKMLCPLCRGQINDWVVVDSARRHMNAKLRSCSSETCEFSGTYTDLRKHARQVHPLVRPTEADPERQRSWRRLERQRDLGDLLSTLQSSVSEEGSESTSLTFDEGGLLTVFLFVRILQPRSNSRSSSWSGSSRTRAQATGRRRPSRRLWGETYEGEIDTRDDENEDSDGGSGPRRRLRRQPTPES